MLKRIGDIAGAEVHLAVVTVEVEVRSAVELALAVRRDWYPNSSEVTGQDNLLALNFIRQQFSPIRQKHLRQVWTRSVQE